MAVALAAGLVILLAACGEGESVLEAGGTTDPSATTSSSPGEPPTTGNDLTATAVPEESEPQESALDAQVEPSEGQAESDTNPETETDPGPSDDGGTSTDIPATSTTLPNPSEGDQDEEPPPPTDESTSLPPPEEPDQPDAVTAQLRQQAIEDLSEAVPWITNPPDDLNVQAADALVELWAKDRELASRLTEYPWLGEPLTFENAGIIRRLIGLALEHPEFAVQFLDLPWVSDTLAPDEIDQDNIRFGVLSTFVSLQLEIPSVGEFLLSQPLFASRVGDPEYQLLSALLEIGLGDPASAQALAEADWVLDGLTEREIFRLGQQVPVEQDTPDEIFQHYVDLLGPEVGEFIYELPNFVQNLPEDLGRYIHERIADLALGSPELMQETMSREWFIDGLTSEEAVLTVLLTDVWFNDKRLYDDLLTKYRTERTQISLPLAGSVTVWMVLPNEFVPENDVVAIAAESARLTESFMKEPFPTNDMILLVADDLEYYVPSSRFGDFVVLSIFQREVYGITDAIVRYYQHHGFEQRWLSTGFWEFLRSYVSLWGDRDSINRYEAELSDSVGLECSSEGIANVLHDVYILQNRPESGLRYADCTELMGAHLLVKIFQTIGEESMSNAMRDLNRLAFGHGTPGVVLRPSEEEIYGVFLDNTPSSQKDDLTSLYRELHGGDFAFESSSREDSHADDATGATTIEVGASVTGTLDYIRDFDYFRFQANAGQKYRIEVRHSDMHPNWVTMFGPDGETLDHENVHSRSAGSSGPEVFWLASTNDYYYVVVENWKGLSGEYTLQISELEDQPDDHGDTPATATDTTWGKEVLGEIDGGFDLDHFRFSVAKDQHIRIWVDGESMNLLEFQLLRLDGSPPTEMSEEQMLRIMETGDIPLATLYLTDLRVHNYVVFGWIAPEAGDYVFAVSSSESGAGEYTVFMEIVE